MPTTPNWLLPYPALTDTPDVPRDMQALANRIELVAPVLRGTSLPATPVDGQLFEWVIDETQGIQWLMRYNAAAATYKWEFVGGPAKQEKSDPEAAPGTLPTYIANGPPITIPKSGQWAFEYGAMMFLGSGPGGIGALLASLLTNGVAGGRGLYYQHPNGTASDCSTVEQRVVAKGATVSVGAALQSGSTGSTQYRWLRWHPIRVAND